MKPQVSIFLLLIFCFGALVPGQTQEELTKMPTLWKHYQVHKESTPSTSFIEYLQLHYGDGFATHRSSHDHSSLPLKSGDNHLHPAPPTVLPQEPLTTFPPIFVSKKTPVFTDQIFPTLFANDIWQPPRSC